MIHFTDVTKAQKVFECLAATARLEILKLVLSREAASLDAIAKTLHLSNGAITQHVKKLADAGLIKLVDTPGKRGTAKRCIPACDRLIIDIAAHDEVFLRSENEFDIPIGSFTSAQVKPYCALARADGWIGERDDPRYFTFPERNGAALIYFNSGKIGWTLPSPAKKPLSVSVSFELSSKPYGHGRKRDSTVSFFFNDVCVGERNIDGEFTDRNGLFTSPFFNGMCQYGKLKTVTLDRNGTFFDGIKIGSTTVDDISGDRLSFALSTESGVALFGKGCGDYDFGLKVRLEYES